MTLHIHFAACASKFPKYALDYGLFVPNGSYAITASHCVQCSCGPGSCEWATSNRHMLWILSFPCIWGNLISTWGNYLTDFLNYCSLYCTPASLAVSCSSMQCRSSNLMLGNVTTQQSSAGCNVTSCSYGGFVNGSITTWYAYASKLILRPHHMFYTLFNLFLCLARMVILLIFWSIEIEALSFNSSLLSCRLSSSLQPRCPGKCQSNAISLTISPLHFVVIARFVVI